MNLNFFSHNNLVQIIQYQTIENYLKKNSTNATLNLLIHHQKKLSLISKKKININSNFLQYREAMQEHRSFIMYFLMYYDWYPHILNFVLFSSLNNVHKIIYFILLENQKLNREWNIFNMNEYINMSLIQFFEFLIHHKKDFVKYFVTKQQQKQQKCILCNLNQQVQLNENYFVCFNKFENCCF
jgi:hypothetical protein